jgi:hypothetical protein
MKANFVIRSDTKICIGHQHLGKRFCGLEEALSVLRQSFEA